VLVVGRVVRGPTSGALRAASDVVEVQGAAEALRRLANVHRFDVVVVECLSERRSDRPRCVGLVQSLFRRYPWLPVVLIGEASVERLRADVLLTGVRTILTKGFSVGNLARAIARVARRRSASVPSSAKVATIRRVFSLLDEHVGEAPSLRELARMTAMSRSHFSRTFHSVAGMPLRGYIRELRLKRAHELLVTGKLSLTAVAVESGFYDLPHFDKAFRRRLGTSPRAFQARHASRRADA
jgi:AraC-like DNA-binding protein